jgi:hypothetical protein
MEQAEALVERLDVLFVSFELFLEGTERGAIATVV